MEHCVRFQMLGNYLIYIDEQHVENVISKTRKGSALMAFLILYRGRQVPNQRLLSELWPSATVTNPENALKTLVSRLRGILNQMSDGLGGCIVSDRGAYHWEQLENVRVDVLELMDTFDALAGIREPVARKDLYQRIVQIYKGDLYQTGDLNEEPVYAQQLHRQYLDCVYDYIDILRQEENYTEICAVCRTALTVDAFDERLHIELMKAMVKLNRVSDAMAQYHHAVNITYRYLGAEPSEAMQAFYHQLNNSRKSLKFNLDAIRTELRRGNADNGALVCDYSMFRNIYDLQRRNLERLGTSMFLGVIMIGDADDNHVDRMRQDSIVSTVIEILRVNLRRGDIITHFAPNVVAVLLPTVNYETGNQVLERIREIFFKHYPNSNIPFHHRLGMLGPDESHDEDDVEV